MYDDNANLGRDDEFTNDRKIRKNSDNNPDVSDFNENLEERKNLNASSETNNFEENSNFNSNPSNDNSTTDFAKEELKSEKEKAEKQKNVEHAKEEFKRMSGAEYQSNAPKDDVELNTPQLDKGKKKGILNPKYKKVVYIVGAIFGITLAILLFSSMFGGGKEEVLEQPKPEDVTTKAETLSTDDLKQLKDNSSGITGQASSFMAQQEKPNYENPNYNSEQNGQNGENGEGTEENYENPNGANGADPNKQQMDEIDAREQESLKALEEMERQAKSDSYDVDDNGDRERIREEVVEKPKKNRNSIRIEGAENNIAVFKGGMTDRIQYVDAKQQKDNALNQMGVSSKNGGKVNGNGVGGKIGGGINIDYQANEVDKLASEVFGTDPTGVKVNGRVGGSAGGGTKTNRTPYYAYEKEDKKYDIFEGTIIPVVIMNEINSDYPGRVSAIVREDVYDSLTGNFLLIPKGSKVMGEMIPLNTNGGLERVATVWDRIILINGDNIFMDNFKGQDLTGIDGIEGKVNKRYFKKIASIVASSVFEGTLGIVSTLPEILLRKYDKRDGVVYSESGGQAGERIGQSLTQIVDGEVQKVVTRPNTVTVKSGTKTNIVVNVDIRLPKFERVRSNK